MTGRRMKNRLCSVRRRRRCTVRRNALPTAWSVCWYVSPARWATQWSPPTCSCCRVPSPPVDRNRPLPAVYVMTNVSINLLLVKFRQQFGLRAFTEGFLVLYVLVTFFHLFVNDLSSAMMVRAAHGMVAAALSSLGIYYGTGTACAPSPERANYRHHRLVASHSPARLFPPNCCRPMNGAVSTSLSWARRWCRWPASSR